MEYFEKGVGDVSQKYCGEYVKNMRIELDM